MTTLKAVEKYRADLISKVLEISSGLSFNYSEEELRSLELKDLHECILQVFLQRDSMYLGGTAANFAFRKISRDFKIELSRRHSEDKPNFLAYEIQQEVIAFLFCLGE